MLRMRMFPCAIFAPVTFLSALRGVVHQEALCSDLRSGRGRMEGWKDGSGMLSVSSASSVHRGNLLRTRSLQHKSDTAKDLTSRDVIRDRIFPYHQFP